LEWVRGANIPQAHSFCLIKPRAFSATSRAIHAYYCEARSWFVLALERRSNWAKPGIGTQIFDQRRKTMRIHFGSVPETQMQPQDGWQPLPDLGAKRLQNFGLLASCIGIVLVGLLLRGGFRPNSTWAALLILVFTVPLHEMIHALATPKWGMSDQTVFGLQRSKGLLFPYMYYDGSLPLRHMLFIGIAPLLLLTVLPILLILFAPLPPAARADLGFLAFFNTGISGGDLVNFLWILRHAPPSSHGKTERLEPAVES
jgi:hypothetical protein